MDTQEHYQYTLIAKRHSSASYGPCEVCKSPASEVYHQTERRQYTRSDGSTGWSHEGCTDTFGHRDCLLALRRHSSPDQSHQAA